MPSETAEEGDDGWFANLFGWAETKDPRVARCKYDSRQSIFLKSYDLTHSKLLMKKRAYAKKKASKEMLTIEEDEGLFGGWANWFAGASPAEEKPEEGDEDINALSFRSTNFLNFGGPLSTASDYLARAGGRGGDWTNTRNVIGEVEGEPPGGGGAIFGEESARGQVSAEKIARLPHRRESARTNADSINYHGRISTNPLRRMRNSEIQKGLRMSLFSDGLTLEYPRVTLPREREAAPPGTR